MTMRVAPMRRLLLLLWRVSRCKLRGWCAAAPVRYHRRRQ
jgi:hypothetical protein